MVYEKLKDRLSTAGFTLPTPFTEDRTAVNHDALEAHVGFLRDAGANLLIPLWKHRRVLLALERRTGKRRPDGR